MPDMLRHSNVKERLDRLRKISGKIEHLRRFHSDFENKEFLQWTQYLMKILTMKR